MKKRCNTCGKYKPIEEFNGNSCLICRPVDNPPAYASNPRRMAQVKRRASEHYYANRETKRKQVSEYQMRKKIEAVNLLGGKCFRCPEEHPACLQFHHRDPTTKLFNITTKILATPKKYPWETAILPEIEKCDLLCANCHAKSHSVWILPEDTK